MDEASYDNITGIPDISVIIPVYNGEKYLSKCIDSVLVQQDVNLEIILIDDGSHDKSSMIADQYAAENNKVNVIHKENKGVSSARNAGLENSIGEYVFFLDADDTVGRNTSLSMMLRCAKEYNADMIESSFLFDGKANRKYNNIEVYTNKNKIGFYFHGHIGYCTGKLMRRRIIESNGISFNEKMNYSEDRNFILRFLAFAKVFCIHRGCIYQIGNSAASLSKKQVSNMSYCCNQILEATKLFLNSCSLNHKSAVELYRRAEISVLQTQINNLYRIDSLLHYQDRVSFINQLIKVNHATINSIGYFNHNSFYNNALNFVIKTKNVPFIYLIFYVKSIVVKLIPRRH